MVRSSVVTYLVSATRERATYFSRSTLLGRSLEQFPAAMRPKLYLRADNHGPTASGLATFYNSAIEALPSFGQVVFLHDDIYLHDWFLGERLQEALVMFDVVGLVGCITPADDQPSATHTLNAELNPVRCSVSEAGVLNHFDPHRVSPNVYGPTPQSCGLLDGCFLACKLETLKTTGLRFDPQFDFHCYDADLCRAAQVLGLSIGTWPIACTHGSPGSFSSTWRQAALKFRQKWSPSPGAV